ncbi:alpha/beta fold hydrolase [Pseudonocardia sp. H11422]|uniref:alpha/beta fold hydrolase n=1 Tax=Pseudonocardia sp. H11422 TaxID=2835866 RepID=UPI001BDBE299|nr:alpha/beta fold hydrolase [Pseudonocardia sp. H11422]
MRTVTRDGLVFDVREAGPSGGEPVLLLHGFPQRADSWDAVVPALTERGYRTLAMDQRGYSPGARPRRRRDYRMAELVADTAAVIDALGGGRVHLVGHDWGAAVAWQVAIEHPERVRSLTALSVPPPEAFLRAMVTSRQALASWYMAFFQLPWVPERLLGAKPGQIRSERFVRALRAGGQGAAAAERDATAMAAPGALTGGLNWYRALPLSLGGRDTRPVTRPTLFVWSDGDVAITRAGVVRAARYVTGPYRLVELPGVSHWIPDEVPGELAALLLEHLTAHPG